MPGRPRVIIMDVPKSLTLEGLCSVKVINHNKGDEVQTAANHTPKEFQLMGLRFFQIRLIFDPGTKSNLFGSKNNKTVGETICAQRYRSLAETVHGRYPGSIHQGLGTFLLERKQAGDLFYSRFLNSYGDETYSRFFIRDANWLTRKGLYCYVVGGIVMYIGQSKDSFGKRINQGYGNISPKNCYLDGQATNCHLNSLITRHRAEVELFVSEVNDLTVIDKLEKMLIKTCQPAWNIALK